MEINMRIKISTNLCTYLSALSPNVYHLEFGFRLDNNTYTHTHNFHIIIMIYIYIY